MRKSIIIGCGAIALLLSCAKNPFTGKSTLALVPNSTIFPMAFQQYDAFLKENKVVKGTPDAQRVVSVGTKIKNAAEKYLKATGNSQFLQGYEWEYHLVEDKQINAWCMPGGKIVFYTGILPITKDEAGMATVMGHEVAHALLEHGRQRMSTDLLQQLAGAGAGIAVSGENEKTQQLVMQAYGVTTQFLVTLPFSRKHENEADEIGLILMSIAGYNPESAIGFWERMAAAGGSAPPEFLSTHPSNTTRINNIKNQIPKAKAEAAKFGVTFK